MTLTTDETGAARQEACHGSHIEGCQGSLCSADLLDRNHLDLHCSPTCAATFISWPRPTFPATTQDKQRDDVVLASSYASFFFGGVPGWPLGPRPENHEVTRCRDCCARLLYPPVPYFFAAARVPSQRATPGHVHRSRMSPPYFLHIALTRRRYEVTSRQALRLTSSGPRDAAVFHALPSLSISRPRALSPSLPLSLAISISISPAGLQLQLHQRMQHPPH